jgi:phosphoglycerol transferase MdoB-like AlkP superfamily enzyme
MSPDLVRWIVGLAVLGHGVGHVLFMPVLSGAMKLESSGRSWLLTGILGDDLTRLVVSLVAGGVLAAFVIAAAGIVAQSGWWRSLVIGAAVVSLVLLAATWGGFVAGPATWAMAFDVVVLVALLVLNWPSRDVIGI